MFGFAEVVVLSCVIKNSPCICEDWKKNSDINPITKKKIQIGKSTHKFIEQLCSGDNAIIEHCNNWILNKNVNPITNRRIVTSGRIYREFSTFCNQYETKPLQPVQQVKTNFNTTESSVTISFRDEKSYTIPKKYSNFSLENIIGEGGFGIVFSGKYYDRPVAIKIESIKFEEELFEIKNLKKSTSLHLPKLYDYFHQKVKNIETGEYNVIQYMILEILEPCSIDFLYEQKKDLLYAIDYLHSVLKIGHNDLKPNNIMKRGDNVVLIDLGLAASFGKQKWYLGTPLTMATFMHSDAFVAEINDLESIVYMFMFWYFRVDVPWKKYIWKTSERQFKKAAKIKHNFLLELALNVNHPLSRASTFILSKGKHEAVSYKHVADEYF